MLSWTHITNFKENKVLLVKTVSSQEDENDVNKVQQRLSQTLCCGLVSEALNAWIVLHDQMHKMAQSKQVEKDLA